MQSRLHCVNANLIFAFHFPWPTHLHNSQCHQNKQSIMSFHRPNLPLNFQTKPCKSWLFLHFTHTHIIVHTHSCTCIRMNGLAVAGAHSSYAVFGPTIQRPNKNYVLNWWQICLMGCECFCRTTTNFRNAPQSSTISAPVCNWTLILWLIWRQWHCHYLPVAVLISHFSHSHTHTHIQKFRLARRVNQMHTILPSLSSLMKVHELLYVQLNVAHTQWCAWKLLLLNNSLLVAQSENVVIN